MGILRILLMFAVAYVVVKVVTRIIMPFRAVKKDFDQKMRQGQNQSQRQTDNRNEGDIRVENTKKSESSRRPLDGEYVEYEEVE